MFYLSLTLLLGEKVHKLKAYDIWQVVKSITQTDLLQIFKPWFTS